MFAKKQPGQLRTRLAEVCRKHCSSMYFMYIIVCTLFDTFNIKSKLYILKPVQFMECFEGHILVVD